MCWGSISSPYKPGQMEVHSGIIPIHQPALNGKGYAASTGLHVWTIPLHNQAYTKTGPEEQLHRSISVTKELPWDVSSQILLKNGTLIYQGRMKFWHLWLQAYSETYYFFFLQRFIKWGQKHRSHKRKDMMELFLALLPFFLKGLTPKQMACLR